MEYIKFNNEKYELVTNGYQIGNNDGKIIFQPGSKTFDEIETELKNTNSIYLLDSDGLNIHSRTDLIYAGRLTKDNNYIVNTNKIQDGIGIDGQPIYKYEDVIGTVYIAEFQEPDLREVVDDLKRKIEIIEKNSGLSI